ncbi:MAG: hypothetical protein ABFS46_19055 [Myxococcota bacterium]
MQGSDVFLTLAEVAIAFAGFASIAILFRRRDQGSWTPEDAFRYRSMLANSLFACAFAFLPLILGRFELTDQALWPTCSALLFIYYAYRVSANVPAAFRLAAQRGEQLPGDFALNIGNATIVLLLQLGNLLAFPFDRGPAPYLAGVALLLANAGTNFFKLVTVPKPSPE